jgi:hypothetical protein
MAVYCFDRDYTVDTNPSPPRMGESVPLEWVRSLAHESPHAVVATGNQHLCREADIPGDDELRARYEALPPATRRAVPAPPEEKPSRRHRLRLVEALFESDAYVVVDDADLRDVEDDRWTHYYPWEFVEAVRDGEIRIPAVV